MVHEQRRRDAAGYTRRLRVGGDNRFTHSSEREDDRPSIH